MAEGDSTESSATEMKPETEWSTREKLAIASYVLRTGEQHWSGVGRLLKPLGEPDRPSDWFSPKYCAQQYTALLDQMDAPRRKRGSERADLSENIQPGSSPEEGIVSRLTKVRIDELKKQLRYERTEYRKLKREIEMIESGTMDDRLDELINEIENEGKEVEVTSEDNDPTNIEMEQINSLAEEVKNEIEKLQNELLENETTPEVANDIKKDHEPVAEIVTKTEENEEIDITSTTKDDSTEPAQTLDNVHPENKEVENKEEKILETSNEAESSSKVTDSSEKEDKPTLKSKTELREVESQKEETIEKKEIEKTEELVKPEPDASSKDTTETEPQRKHSLNSDTASSEVTDTGNAFNFSIEDTLQRSLSLPGTPAPPGSFISDSFPSSPALSHSSDMDPDATASWKAWRKSIMILWKQVASHRYASLFLQPVTDDIAPNYSTTVYRSMDLSLLKKNIENGVIRTTTEFHRDLMLMFQNAIMYNSREHDVYMMTTEMQKDVMDQVAQFMSTQMMAETTQPSANKSLRRSTMRRSAFNEKNVESRSRRSAAADNDGKMSRS